jgi:hypothetical protein
MKAKEELEAEAVMKIKEETNSDINDSEPRWSLSAAPVESGDVATGVTAIRKCPTHWHDLNQPRYF